MRKSWLCAASLLLGSVLLYSQHPVPPGLRRAENMTQPADAVPPLSPQTRRTDPAQLKREADELAALAQTVPAGVDQVNRGVLPKDFQEKLKRIEKLSKLLRTQIAP